MPQIILIDDPSDVRIEDYCHVRERDLSGRQGLFLAEGKLVLESLLASSLCQPVSLLLSQRHLAPLAELLARLPQDLAVYAAEQRVIDAIAGFPLHRGILALGRRVGNLSAEHLLQAAKPRSLFLVLIGIANHDNMGGVFRNAAAFGVQGIILDSTSCDPLYRKSIRVSVGAALRVPFARLEKGEDPLARLGRHGFDCLALSPRAAYSLAEFHRPSRLALFLGAEGSGLPTSLIAACPSARIDMAPGFDSLNLATASGIALYQLAHARSEG